MRSLSVALAVLLAPAVAAAQGWIVPRPCAVPPPCRAERCPPIPPCPRPGIGGVERIASEVRAELVGRVVRYEVSETFVNRGAALGEADYMFPMPKGAAFQDLKLSINGELVSGETMSAEKARGIYEEIVRRQRDPALVEWMGYGLLRTRIFPINPGEEKRVVVRFQTVAEREGDALRIDYQRASRPASPSMPTPMPRIRPEDDEGRRDGDASRESGNTFTLTYERDAELGEPYSPTHRLRARDRGARRTVVASGEAPQVTILIPLRRATTASMTMLAHAPGGGREDGFALITITPPSNAPRRTPRDVTLVLDVSGSMRGRKMEQARAAAHQFLGTLSPDDRFRLIDFSTDVRAFREGFVPATEGNRRAAARYVDELRAEGSTNISGALEDALDADRGASSERMRLVLFLTDGEPTVGERDPGSIAALAAKLRRGARVFTFGVGAEANATLMEQLALEGRGTAHFVRPEENVERVVTVVANRLTAPLVTDVQIRADGVRLRQMHPATPVDIFAGQDLVLLARYDGTGEARLRVEGRSSSGPVSWTTTVRFPERERENAFVARLWATQRLGWLAAEKRRGGGSSEMNAEIRELGMRYGIPTEFSSYLVVEPGMQVADIVGASTERQRRAGRVAGVGGGVPPPTVTSAASPEAANAPMREQRFEAAKSAAAQRAAVSLDEADSAAGLSKASASSLRRVGARVFALSDGVWVDGRYAKGTRTMKVKAYSAAYFAVLERIPELRESFALGERVIVAGRRVAIEVAPDGTERLGVAELDALEREW